MSQPTDKQLSRRDALKLLGAAAGASVLANLPSKWSTPQSVAGVLPAHATSSLPAACAEPALKFESYWNPDLASWGSDMAGPPADASGFGTGSQWVSWKCETEGCVGWGWTMIKGDLAVKIYVWGVLVEEVSLSAPQAWQILVNLQTGKYAATYDVGNEVEGCGGE